MPLNDPESHEVYWIDHPDLLASTSEAQVQRGVGSALYGAASVGGSVEPRDRAVTEAPSATGTIAYGSYDTKRLVLEMNSGPARPAAGTLRALLARSRPSGYRDAVVVASCGRTRSARAQGHGTSLVRPQAVRRPGGDPPRLLGGITRSELDGLIAGRDRRFNPLTYPGEADHFFEPHYELHPLVAAA